MSSSKRTVLIVAGVILMALSLAMMAALLLPDRWPTVGPALVRALLMGAGITLFVWFFQRRKLPR